MATLVLLEVALRLLGLACPVLYEPDPAAGYRLQPNQRVTHLGNDIIINAWGIRDPRDLEDRRPETRRILVLGDSVTWGGVALRQEELFTARLEHELRDLGHPTDVLNAGVNGYSVAQMTALYETHLAGLEPDSVLVYAIPRDFVRSPKTELVRHSVVFPMRRPRLALGAAASLARTQVYRRLDWEWLAPAPVTRPRAGEYDESAALAENIAAYQRLDRITGGRSTLLLAPTRGGVGDAAVEQALQAASVPYTRVGDHLTPHDWEKCFADEVHLTRLGHEAAASAIVEILTATAAKPLP